MPRLDAEALSFGLAWAALAVTGGLLAGWGAAALLSVGLLIVIVPTSSLILSRTDSFAAERLARWALLAAAALALAAWLAFRR